MLGNLNGADTFLVGGQQPNSEEPLLERQARFFKDGANTSSKLLGAVFALKNAARVAFVNRNAATMGAGWQTVPPHILKVIYASIFVSKLVVEAYEVIHALSIANRGSCVKYISATSHPLQYHPFQLCDI